MIKDDKLRYQQLSSSNANDYLLIQPSKEWKYNEFIGKYNNESESIGILFLKK